MSIPFSRILTTCAAGVLLAGCDSSNKPAGSSDGGQESPARHIALEGQPNFRDLGGYKTADGRTVKWRQLFRTGELAKLSDADMEKLADLELSTLVNFLLPEEIEKHGPDRLPDGVKELSDPIAGERAAKLTMQVTAAIRSGEFDKIPPEMNPEFHSLLMEEGREQYAKLLRSAADPDQRPLVFHCSHGVHRTGTAAAILLSALGVPWETIREDYLLTNELRAEQTKAGLAKIRAKVAEVQMKNTMNTDHPTRRDLLKAAGFAAAGGALGLPARARAAESGKPKITIAGYDSYDRIAALAAGRVAVEGFDHTFETTGIGDLNTHAFSGPGTREVTEIGLHPFMLAYANDGFRDYSLLPVFPLRTFRHKSIFIRTDRGITTPADLKGRKVGTPGFSSSSLTWLRGIMEHEYGLKPSDVQWVVSTKDSSADTSGKVSKQENMIPKGLSVSKGPAGKDESQMLVDGDVDALFHALEPKAYVQGNPIVGRLFPDFRTTERAYFEKTGIFPIMHAVAIRNDVVEKHPGLPKALFDAYSQSKQLANQALRKLGWANISLPWIGQEIEETRQAMGDNFWSCGIKGNEKTLNALFQYSHEQGLANKRLTIKDLFHPATLEFAEV